MSTRLTTTKAFSFTFALALAGLLAWPQMGTGWGKEGSGQLPLFDGKFTWIMATEADKQEEGVDWTLADRVSRDISGDETDWTLAHGESDAADEDETDWTLASNDSSEEEEEVDWTLA
ncbi:hypothetical protein [Candidatus Nitrospira neomarina]|uniref:Uncharacterized protein n=1 Tax=Candidatus Nitrospira neomarina TaxID=3020899 RepID=A0AA96JUP0_9BACT|nr:hypothetical protein [Candidatus Nitrospira neomarina]WNM60255.1 hypothetical protein PQG83_10815 [Candidatus Nitrospira neomarina]